MLQLEKKTKRAVVWLGVPLAVLAIAAGILGWYIFKDKGRDVAIKKTDTVDSYLPPRAIEKLVIERDDNNLTQQAFSSLLDVIKAETQDENLDEKEVEGYLKQKIDSVKIFEYSFKKEEIKISKNKASKADMEKYFIELYALLPPKTIFSEAVDLLALEDEKDIDSLIQKEEYSFAVLLKKEVPIESIVVHEVYLKLLDSEIELLKILKNKENDPLKARKMIEQLQEEWLVLQQQLNQELERINKEYGVEFEKH